jgi:hypothetical protein
MVEITMPLRIRTLIAIAIFVIPSAARGHVLDEYLQSTLVTIEPGEIRLHMNLTPGVEIADKILSEIDPNHDGTASHDETAAYAEALKRDLSLQLDRRNLALKVTKLYVPEFAELGTGHAIISIELTAEPRSIAAGMHKLSFENRHFNSIGAYLFNAGRPESTCIKIREQIRNSNQSKGEIVFACDAPPRSTKMTQLFAALALLSIGLLTTICFRRFTAPAKTG